MLRLFGRIAGKSTAAISRVGSAFRKKGVVPMELIVLIVRLAGACIDLATSLVKAITETQGNDRKKNGR